MYIGESFNTTGILTKERLFPSMGADMDRQGTALYEGLPTISRCAAEAAVIGVYSNMALKVAFACELLKERITLSKPFDLWLWEK